MRIVAQRNPEQLVQEARSYLDSTDWYCARQVDEGTPVPDDIKTKRAAAREVIRQSASA